MAEGLKILELILILMAGIFLTSSNSLLCVNAQPTSTSLAITSSYNPPWKARTIEATLRDEYDNPLQNFDIDFWYECDDHTHLLWPAKTDSNGVASITWTWSYGTYNVSATFSGTPNYASSSSEYVEITIIDYTPYLMGSGLVAVAITGVVGSIVYRRRKKAITMPKTAREAQTPYSKLFH